MTVTIYSDHRQHVVGDERPTTGLAAPQATPSWPTTQETDQLVGRLASDRLADLVVVRERGWLEWRGRQLEIAIGTSGEPWMSSRCAGSLGPRLCEDPVDEGAELVIHR